MLNGRQQPFDEILEFFNDPDRQRRMEESELHHDRPPLAGVVRKLESLPEIDRFLATQHPRRAKRLRQAVGVVVRILMERRGWQTTGKKGSPWRSCCSRGPFDKSWLVSQYRRIGFLVFACRAISQAGRHALPIRSRP